MALNLQGIINMSLKNKIRVAPFEQLNYQVKYNLLSSDIKKYLLETLSGEPFDLLKTLENNGLSPPVSG